MSENTGIPKTVAVHPASFLRRFSARIIDLVAFKHAACWLEAGLLWSLSGMGRRAWAEAMSRACHACGFWADENLAAEWLYWPCLNAPAMLEGLVLLAGMAALEAAFLSVAGWTPGTWLMRVRRTAEDGCRMTFPSAFLRSFRVISPFLVLFWLPFFVLPDWAESGALLIGLALCLLDPIWQALRMSAGRAPAWDVRFGTRVTTVGKGLQGEQGVAAGGYGEAPEGAVGGKP